jgi:hypothetical protein
VDDWNFAMLLADLLQLQLPGGKSGSPASTLGDFLLGGTGLSIMYVLFL